MMKTHTINTHIALYMVLLPLITGCSKYSASCGDHYDYLSFNIPYQQGDVITFTDSIGNKLVFTLERREDGYYTKPPSPGLGDCGPVKNFSQYNNYFFKEKNNKASLFIGNYAYGDTIYNMSESVCIGVNGVNFAYSTEWLKINLLVIPEITLNGKKYTNIFIPDAVRGTGNQKTYYSKQYGLVGFQTDSVLWSLE